MSSQTSLSGLRVLVAEDEYLIADETSRALRAQGAEVIGPVGTQDEALRLVASEPLDLAVLDINLHGATTFRVADALREKAVPFVFATGYDQSDIPHTYRDVPRWEKPFNADALVRALPRLVSAT